MSSLVFIDGGMILPEEFRAIIKTPGTIMSNTKVQTT